MTCGRFANGYMILCSSGSSVAEVARKTGKPSCWLPFHVRGGRHQPKCADRCRGQGGVAAAGIELTDERLTGVDWR